MGMSLNGVQVIVHLDRLRRNAGKLAGLHAGLIAVVKADAYGHGRERVARALEEEGLDFLAAGTVGEAVLLRRSGVQARLLSLLGPVEREDPGAAAAHRVIPLVHDRESLRLAEAHGAAAPLDIAVKFDSGMSRLGFVCEDAAALAESLRVTPSLRPVLAVSHLACADDAGQDACTRDQALRFCDAVAALRAVFPELESSLGNSPGLLARPELAGDRPRPGLALYGLNPLHGTARAQLGEILEPVMEARAPVVSVHPLRRGAGASYGHTFVAPGDMRVAVIAAGYADGFPRALSGRGSVLLDGRRAPVLGRVCMQMTLVDVTDIPGVKVGDQAFLLGGPGENAVSAHEIARLCGTIPYEIVCGLGRNRREYLGA